MLRPTLRTFLAALSRRSHRPKNRQRNPLQLINLEERLVPALVAPQSYWDDGHYNSYGYREGITVNLHNSGSGWLEVSGGNGSVSVAAASAPPDYYGGQPPSSKNYALEVFGYGFDGDVTWSGEAESLYIRATGDIGAVSVGGSVTLDAGQSIGNVSSGEIGSIKAIQSIGTVHASGDLWSVTSSNGGVGAVVASGKISEISAGEAVASVTAGTTIKSVRASKSIGPVIADGWIGTVAAGEDVGAVTSKASIGGAFVPNGDYWSWMYATYGEGVSAGRDVTGEVRAGGHIASVSAGRSILAPIVAGGDVWRVKAGNAFGSYYPTMPMPGMPGMPGPMLPPEPGHITGSITAERNIHWVAVTGNITGNIESKGTIVGVNADGFINSSITAGTDIGKTPTTPYGDSDWRPFYSDPYWYGGTYGYLPLGTGVRAKGNVSGSIDAKSGDVTSISTEKNLSATVHAGMDAGSVQATTGLSGVVTAGRDIGSVTVGGMGGMMGMGGPPTTVADISGAITAGRDVGFVSVWNGSLIGDVTAGTGSIGSVMVDDRIAGKLSAGKDIGNVTTRRGDIEGAIRASRSLGNVLAGVQDGASLTGSLWAAGDIGSVIAYGTGGQYATTYLPGPDMGLSNGIWSYDNPTDTWTHSSVPTERPSRPVLAGGGDIRGTIGAGGSINGVTAFGIIAQTVSAGESIGTGGLAGQGVWALGDIRGDISAGGVDPLWVRTWGGLDGKVTAKSDVRAWSWGDLRGDLESSTKGVTAGSWHNLVGSVVGSGDVDVRSFLDIGVGLATGGVVSRNGAVKVWAGESMLGNLSAEKDVVAFAVTEVWGNAVSGSGKVLIEVGEGAIANGRFEGKAGVRLTAAQDIRGYAQSDEGSITIDAGRSVMITDAKADKNLWIAARTGSVDGRIYTARTGWAYVWAMDDVGTQLSGITAHETVSVTAWRDIKSRLESTDDGVEAFAGRNLSGDVVGRYWVDIEARGDISGAVTAGVGTEWGEVIARAGGSVTGAIHSKGLVDVAAVGDILTNVTADDGWLDVVANGRIQGTFIAGDDATLWAGGNIGGTVTAKWELDVTAKGNVNAITKSLNGSASVWSGGDVTGSVHAPQGDVFVEAVGTVSGDAEAKDGAAVLANGDILGQVTARWVADARSTNGKVLGNVSTTATSQERFTADDSPTKKRIDVIDAKLVELQTKYDSAPDDPSRSKYLEQMNDLRAEREMHTLEDTSFDPSKISASVVRDMLADGLAKEYRGYVAIADLVGTGGYSLILEPMRHAESSIIVEPGVESSFTSIPEHDYSIAAWENPSQHAMFYRVVRRIGADIVNPANFLAATRGDEHIHRNVDAIIEQQHVDAGIAALGAVEFGLRLIPLVGAFDDFSQGNYIEGAISLAGDLSLFLGFGAVLKTVRCSYAGKTMVRMSIGIEGGISAFRIGQGVNSAINGETGQAWAYFGDATLRLLGLSAIAISWLKKQPICFVAGTPVHIEGGTKPIEEIQAGDRVWAFDRQSETWRLCEVTRTFRNLSQGRMATVVLSNGDEVSGTDGHPVWVIEGEEIAERGRPDHGADEPDGPTPGRWVGLGELRVGDAALTRGGVARVREVRLSQFEVPVYNLEVEDLHCYAVGSGGLLAHNTGPGDCHLPGGNPAGKSAATTPDSPDVKAPKGQDSVAPKTPAEVNVQNAGNTPHPGSTADYSNFPLENKGIIGNLDQNGYVEFKINTEGAGIRGTDLFKQMMAHFGENAKGVKGKWVGGTNLNKVNELTAQGIPLEEAITKTWTANRAREAGYGQATLVKPPKGTPGAYTDIEVVFTK